MDPPQALNFTKRLYSSPSAGNFATKSRPSPEPLPISKAARARRTEQDDKNSQINSSRARIHTQQQQHYQDGGYVNESRVSGRRNHDGNMIKVLSEKEETVIQLKERLKNIHHFYRIRIEEERAKNIERNQIFIGIIQQLQKAHNDKIVELQKSLQQIEDEKKQIGIVDQRMGTIKNTIEQILKQSQQLKVKNQHLQKQIMSKQAGIKQKQNQYSFLKGQVDQMRQKLQEFQLLKLKENKRNKELLQMIESAF